MSVFQPPQTPFPTHPFESLLPTLINLLKIVHSDNPSSQPQQQHRLAIASAVEDLQSLITHATELINTLPGGEMLPRDQDAVIAALEKLKSEKLGTP
ncbi:hypothetical protein FRB99_007387 [Tulasnella sp. 403]|nr:hypothetical protein FRB99_007387 [Tulasnella sp. 403]